MNDLQGDIARMGFDAEMAHNLSEIVRITRETAIEECAKVAAVHNGISPKDSRDIAAKIRNLADDAKVSARDQS